MRRALKVLLWVAVFAACFGVGAYVAAHTDPFPPGVDDPGARPGEGSSPVGSAAPGTWPVTITARTAHDLYVGGRCAGNWRIALGLEVGDPGIGGSGAATLQGDLRCDEPTAQIQAEQIGLEATGTSVDGELRFTLDVTTRTPVGAQDLTGLVKTIPTLRFRLAAREGATASFDISVPDGDRGTYVAVGQVVVGAPPA